MNQISPVFVDSVPAEIKEGNLYVSIKFKTCIHLCACGCKNEVVTPLSPSDWLLKYNGEAISLSPSIGNWNFKCQSHYWIKNNEVVWARKWSEDEILDGREQSKRQKTKMGKGRPWYKKIFNTKHL